MTLNERSILNDDSKHGESRLRHYNNNEHDGNITQSMTMRSTVPSGSATPEIRRQQQ